jgi:hypothetical protein
MIRASEPPMKVRLLPRGALFLRSAIELVEIGDVATIEYLEKELAFAERLDAMIVRN